MSAAFIRDINDLPVVLNMKQVQNVLGISRVKAYELAQRADFPVVRIGRTIRVARASLMRWLDQQSGLEE